MWHLRNFMTSLGNPKPSQRPTWHFRRECRHIAPCFPSFFLYCMISFLTLPDGGFSGFWISGSSDLLLMQDILYHRPAVHNSAVEHSPRLPVFKYFICIPYLYIFYTSEFILISCFFHDPVDLPERKTRGQLATEQWSRRTKVLLCLSIEK